MKMKTLACTGLAAFLACAAGLRAQTAGTVPAPVPAPGDFYQSALQAYLVGDFDHAILFDSKALQDDPQDKKAQALLNILVSEQDAARKSVIWIGDQAATVQASAAAAPPPSPVTVIRERTVRERPAASSGMDARKLAELEARVQTVAFLMERDSFSQYRELSGAQAQTTQRLDELTASLKDLGSGLKLSALLFLLALLVSSLALWKSWKNGRDLERRLAFREDPDSDEGKNQVVKLRRM
jgi:hypothetical protein